MEYKGGFARWAPGRGLSFLLYSPAHDGGHIKWPPVRAELAINFISARPTGKLPIRDEVYFGQLYHGKYCYVYLLI